MVSPLQRCAAGDASLVTFLSRANIVHLVATLDRASAWTVQPDPDRLGLPSSNRFADENPMRATQNAILTLDASTHSLVRWPRWRKAKEMRSRFHDEFRASKNFALLLLRYCRNSRQREALLSCSHDGFKLAPKNHSKSLIEGPWKASDHRLRRTRTVVTPVTQLLDRCHTRRSCGRYQRTFESSCPA